MVEIVERSGPPERAGVAKSKQTRVIQGTWAGIRIQLLFHSLYGSAVFKVCGMAHAGVGRFGFRGDL
jgi:hypothetical protein